MTNSSGESTSVHPQARFRGDLASIIESHSVLHRSPADALKTSSTGRCTLMDALGAMATSSTASAKSTLARK